MSRSRNSDKKYKITAEMQIKFARAARRLEGRTVRGGAHSTSKKDYRQDNELRIYRSKSADFAEGFDCETCLDDLCWCWYEEDDQPVRIRGDKRQVGM